MVHTSERKQRIRENIWKEMKRRGIERFPYAWGRIPNFQGAEKAAITLSYLAEFQNARTVFVAPDSPQRPVRELALEYGKILIMPTPRLKSGFIIIKPVEGIERNASSIEGAFRHGKTASIERTPAVDLVVQGAVAVDREGGRLGKGGGYGDREVAALKSCKKMDKARIAVTVHDIQITEELPQDEWDFKVDIIVTPTQVIRTAGKEDVSKYLSYLLRHNPPETVSRDGFVSLDDISELVSRKYPVDKEYIVSLLRTNSKGRFQIVEDKIRALYGHSYLVRIELPAADIEVLYHGTTKRAGDHILKEGLKPKRRQKVHLSSTPETAVEVGKRRCKHPVILRIDAQKALKDGILIERASEQVYVADFIPPKYISVQFIADS